MAAQATAESDQPARGPVDRCPYSRSFSAEFADDPACPAYQGATFAVTDTAHRPLGSALTCRHLTVGTDPRNVGRFYPRCGLGAPEQRFRWVATVTPGRLAVMRSLEEEFDELTRDERARLVAAKARLLADRTPDGAAMDALEVQLSLFLDRVDEFISSRGERLADVGLRTSQLRQLLSEWSLAWLRGHSPFGPAGRELRKAARTPAAAAFLGAAIDRTDVPVREPGEVVAAAGALAIERLVDPATLRLRGEIDVSNSDALATAVAAALADGDVTVDFSDVLFCDLSGLRALVRATAGSDRPRITVTGLPSHLHRAIRLVGWADLPGLAIASPDDGTAT